MSDPSYTRNIREDDYCDSCRAHDEQTITALEAENARLKARAERAEKVVEAAKELVDDFGTAAGIWAKGRPSVGVLATALDAYEKGEK